MSQMSFFLTQINVGQQSSGQRRPKEPDQPVIKTHDEFKSHDHGRAYVTPSRMITSGPSRQHPGIKIEEIEDNADESRKRLHDGSDQPTQKKLAVPRQLLQIEAKPFDFNALSSDGHIKDEKPDLVSQSDISNSLQVDPPRSSSDSDDDDDDDDDDDISSDEVSDVDDPEAAARAIIAHSHSVDAEEYPHDRPPAYVQSPPMRRSPSPMPYEQGSRASGQRNYYDEDDNRPHGLFGEGEREDYYNEMECDACVQARIDLSKRCAIHGKRLSARPTPRSSVWKNVLHVCGAICSPDLCVLCIEINITSNGPIEREIRDMVIKLPEVLKMSGVVAGAMFLQKTWKKICDTYWALIPSEKRNLYIEMNGSSLLWHLSETANIAEINMIIDAAETRSCVRRVRDVDVLGSVGSDDLDTNEAAGLSKEGLQKLNLLEKIQRQNRITMPAKTYFTYNAVPQPTGDQYRIEYRRVSSGQHLN